jgi:hypothetical protein
LDGQGSKSNIVTKKIMSGFRAIGIWPLNPKAMDHKTRPNHAYIIEPTNILYMMKVNNGGRMELP